MNIPTRNDLPALLTHHSLTRLGAELGVAGGTYSEHLLRHAPIRRLYSIDAWSGERGHDLIQCDAATRRLSKYGARSIVLRARFAEALALFDDAGLDFVYIDGYAHQGNEDGETLQQWWPKIRPGGILAGHDYHPKWPRNLAAVDAFREAHGDGISQFQVTAEDRFPSWVIFKA